MSTIAENFIFNCLLDNDSSYETENCIHRSKVPSGTFAILKCKPPFYGHNGTYNKWTCTDGFWEGNFDQTLKCYVKQLAGRPNSETSTLSPVITTERPVFRFTTSSTMATIASRRTSTAITTTSTPWTSDPSQKLPIFTTKATTITTRATTRRPASTTTLKSLIKSSTTAKSKPILCPPLLPKSEGVSLECVSKLQSSLGSQSEQITLNVCDIPQPIGAEAKYSCKKYYESTAGLVTIYRKCNADGSWTGSAENFNCIPECGRNNEVFVPLITSGTPSFRGQWPWHGAMFLKEQSSQSKENYEENVKWSYICGGTLISKRTFLTASHCVTFAQSSSARNVSYFRIDFGRFQREGVDDIIQEREILSIHLHPSYSPFGYDSDIAIIILKTPINIGYHVRPACFPQTLNSALEELQLADNSLGTVVGWGFNENSELSDSLHMAQLRVSSQQDCSAGIRGVNSLQIKSTTYCARSNSNGSKAVNVCNGDSGGGMYFPLSNSDFPRWYLQGIVSVGIADNNGLCKPDQYSIFTRVGRYADWILRVMSESNAL